MTEKQKYLLKLFREVDEICREHNLRYVLAGGSLIGALRHEGFVPWDDDVHFRATHPPIPVPSIRARSSGRTAVEKS